MRVTLLSPAKVNLNLLVIRRRSDGYHEVETLLQTIALFDRLVFSQHEQGINLLAPAGLPQGRENLCYIAAEMFYGCTSLAPAVTIELTKSIPIEAGLGGGSSNAACVLLGLNALYGSPLDMRGLELLAARIGSDVPFFLRGGTAKATGRGEIITPLPDLGPKWLRIIKPPFGLSTARVYREWHPVVRSSSSNRYNDLEAVALKLRPELAEIKALLVQDGAEESLLCGSGSAMCGFYEARPTRDLPLGEGYRQYIVPTLTAAECQANIQRGESAL